MIIQTYCYCAHTSLCSESCAAQRRNDADIYIVARRAELQASAVFHIRGYETYFLLTNRMMSISIDFRQKFRFAKFVGLQGFRRSSIQFTKGLYTYSQTVSYTVSLHTARKIFIYLLTYYTRIVYTDFILVSINTIL